MYTTDVRNLVPNENVETITLAGDILKFKRLGMKRKYLVLGSNDRIKDGDIFCAMFYDGLPDSYIQTLEKFSKYDPAKLRYHQTNAEGDFVNEHRNRIYLRPLPF